MKAIVKISAPPSWLNRKRDDNRKYNKKIMACKNTFLIKF